MTEQKKLPFRYAFEGIGGSGKSHLLKEVLQEIESQGIEVLTHKVSGLGESSRINTLRKIFQHREKLIADQQASPKQLDDKQTNRVFRLATKAQIQELARKIPQSEALVGLFDRTPITPWVYSAAAFPENKALDPLLLSALQLTRQLELQRIFLLDVSAETAYARALARACIGLSPAELAEQCLILAELIQADNDTVTSVQEKAETLLRDNTVPLKSKPFTPWDFIPARAKKAEREQYLTILRKLTDEYGIPHTVIDAEQHPTVIRNQILEQIFQDIRHSLKGELSE